MWNALTEESSSFTRAKPRWLSLSIAYRLVRVARLCLGDRRVLRSMLNLSWITRRLSHELNCAVYPGEYSNETQAVTRSLLAKYVPQDGTVVDVGCGHGRLGH